MDQGRRRVDAGSGTGFVRQVKALLRETKTRTLGVAAAHRSKDSSCERCVLGKGRHRPFSPGKTGRAGPQGSRRRRQGDSDPPRDVRSHGAAGDARGNRRLRERRVAAGVRESCRSLAGLVRLRRALGPALAGRGPLRRIDGSVAQHPLSAFSPAQTTRPVCATKWAAAGWLITIRRCC